MLNLTHSPSGYRVYDAQPGTVAVDPMLINAYSTLTVPAYWRAINFLADNLASFPRAVRRDDGAKAEQRHTLSDLLDHRGEPNGTQNAFTFWRTLFFHTAHAGNGFAWVEREAFGFGARALHNMMPEDVWPFRYDRADGRGALQYYLWRPYKRVLAAIDVIHLAALSHDGMIGIDPVALHSSTFQRAATLDRFQTKYLRQGTVIRGAIEIPTGISKENVEEIQATLRNYFRGSDAERDVLILSDGAKLNNQTLSPQESQIVQQGGYSTKQISQITGVPPQFLYEFSESKYNNSIEQMGQDVVRYTFRPWIIQTEAELSLKLLTRGERRQGLYVGLNPDALLRGDTKTQTETLVATVTGRIRTPNEAREHLGLPRSEDPEADKLKAPGDTSPIEGAGEGTTPAAPETPPADDTVRYTVREAATMTGMSEAQISKLATAGKIVSNGKTGPERRVCALSIMEYMKERGGGEGTGEVESDEEVEEKFRKGDE